MKEHFQQKGECALCQITQDDLLIHESNHFKSIVPYAAKFPFEIWIIPRLHSSHFHELNLDMVKQNFSGEGKSALHLFSHTCADVYEHLGHFVAGE